MDEQSLNELLECSVCLERLDHTSKVLPCQHTFCRRCLDEIVSTKRELRCPECRTLVEIRIEELPSNILLIRLLEGLKTKNNERLRPTERRNEHLSLSAVQHLRQGLSRLNQPCAKALFNYEARDHGDLSFKKGDVIILRKQVDENWYHGECEGQHGFFPASYAQVIIPLPVTIPQCKALYDFDFEKESEKKDCLCFKKDELITVIKRVDDNWVEGRKGEKIGIFPISFVEMNEAAKTLINVKSNPALHAGNRGHGEGAPAGPSSDLLNPAVLAGQHQKRHSYTGSSQQQNSVITKQHNRRSLDLNSKTNLEILQMPVTNSDRVRSPPPVPNPVKDRSGAMTTSVVTTSVTHKTRKETGNDVTLEPNSQNPARSMMAMFNYKPQKDDEVELKKGDYYHVTETCLDGWFRGKCVKTGKIGVFPGNYVQPVRSPSAFRAVGGNIQNIRAKLPPSQPVPGGATPLSTGPDLSRSKKSSSPVRQRSSSARPSGSPSRASSSPSRSSSSPQRSSTVPPSVTPRVSKTPTNSSSSSHPTSSVSATALSSSTSSSSSLKMTSTEAHSHDRQPHTGGATTYLSSSSRHHHNNHSSMSVVQHSTSATPPNVVLGATAEKSVVPTVKDREKKEKNPKEKISLVKRLVNSGKNKKSKSPATDAEGASSSSDSGVTHFRSGSFPTDVISIPEGQHAKSSSFDSSVLIPPPVKPGKSKHFIREKFRCKEPYPPQSEIELELKVGDIVYVHKKRDDGWYKGTLQRTGKSGLFPGSFVEKFD